MLKIIVRHKLALAAVWALSMTGTSAHGDIIHACVLRTTGALRIMDANKSCAPNERRIQWDQIGPAGPAGPRWICGTRRAYGARWTRGTCGTRWAYGTRWTRRTRGTCGTRWASRPGRTGGPEIAFAAETTKSWLVLLRERRDRRSEVRDSRRRSKGAMCTSVIFARTCEHGDENRL